MTNDLDYVREQIFAALDGLTLEEILGTLEIVKYEVVMNTFQEHGVN